MIYLCINRFFYELHQNVSLRWIKLTCKGQDSYIYSVQTIHCKSFSCNLKGGLPRMRNLCRKTQWKSKKTFCVSQTLHCAKIYNKYIFVEDREIKWSIWMLQKDYYLKGAVLSTKFFAKWTKYQKQRSLVKNLLTYKNQKIIIITWYTI